MAGYRCTSLTAIVFLSLFFLPVNAQDEDAFEIGVSAGTFIYQGDLTPSPFGSRRTASYAFGASVTRRFTGLIAVRAEFYTGSLRGDEAIYILPEWRSYRAFRFETPVREAALYLLISPFGNDSRLTPYLLAGAAVAFLDIERDHSRFTHAYFPEEVTNGLQRDLEKTPPGVLPVLPSGLGLKYRLHPRWQVNIEGKYRLMYTDYLDGFSESAEPDMNDHYITYSLGFSYCRGKEKAGGCPTFD